MIKMISHNTIFFLILRKNDYIIELIAHNYNIIGPYYAFVNTFQII